MFDQAEYNVEFQKELLSYMAADATAFTQCQNILDPEHFDGTIRKAVRFMLDYSNEHRAIPTLSQIKALTNVVVDKFEEPSPQHNEWFLKSIEGFARYKALESCILDGPELLQKGQGGELERRVKDAMTISLMRDLGTDYFRDPLTRLQRMKDRSQYVSTGWRSIDDKLLGGFTRGGLNVFAGGSGSGKSLFLQNIALNWASMGMNVIYFTLELSEDLVSIRLDAMVSGTATKHIFTSDKNMNEVAAAIRATAMRDKGTLVVKKLPEGGTNANDLRAFMKEYEIKTGIRPDAVVIDYLDLMHPNNRAINPSDLFVKDKYTSEEMRGLASEFDVLCATASQLNRSSVEASEFDHSHIAGGISKINTADNVFAIFTHASKREAGVYELQFLKTRSSSAVGSKIELAYDPLSMRIKDKEMGAGEVLKSASQSQLQAQVRDKLKNAELKSAHSPKPYSSAAPVGQPQHEDDANDPPPKEISGSAAVSDLMKRMRAKNDRC